MYNNNKRTNKQANKQKKQKVYYTFVGFACVIHCESSFFGSCSLKLIFANGSQGCFPFFGILPKRIK